MLDFLRSLFDASAYTPRQDSPGWGAGLVGLYVAADVLTGLACLALLALLEVCARRAPPWRTPLRWCGLFLLAVGLAHFLDALVFFVPLYRLVGLALLAVAVTAWGTVLALVPVLPRTLAPPEPNDLEKEVQESRRTEEALRLLNETLERRVAERTAVLEQQTGELHEMNRALVRSNQELDDFAYIASHDLKEPLRGIANYSQFLLEDYGDKLDDEGTHKLETLGHLSKRMAELIDSLHQYSRLGRVELAVAPTDLNEVLAAVRDALRITLEEKAVEVRVPRPLPVIACDRVRVGEIFHNLITNAVKYNDKPQKWVEVGWAAPARPGGPGVFYVRDNGLGIRERHLEAIFRMFKRLHGREQYGGGTGVGLTIAKRIVERHGGRIWAESAYGQGTTFYFTLAPEGEDDGEE
jgi:signal transduction histidine kinase